MRTDTSISPATAAKLTGKHKTTVTRAVEEGKISAFKDDGGRLWIEPAELFRVFPASTESDAASMQGDEHATSRIASNVDDKLLRNTDAFRVARIDALERELALERDGVERERRQLEATIDDLRRRLDQSEMERRQKDQQLTALLTDRRSAEEKAADALPVPEASPQSPRRNGLWAWLTGRA